MTITLNIHDSWGAHPDPLARLLAHVAALEQPAPWTPPVTREPGLDDDAASLAQLLDGIDAPEPAPAPAAKPKPAAATPPATRPSARPFEGIPTTGSQLYRFCCDHKLLPAANRIGKREGWHKLVTHWEADMVSLAYGELTALQPATNGQATR
jgi:hypothetical protein